MKGKNKIQKIKIGWDDGYARQKPPIRIDYNKYHHYWHMYQILKRFIKRGSLVLECGCGLNNSTTGLDLSKRNLQTQGVTQFTLIKGDVNNIPISDNTFDVVFSTGLLEHFSEPKKIVNEMARVLKQGGLLIIQIPNFHTGSLMWLIEDILFRRGMSETHFKLDLKDINSWLLAQNLRIISSEYIGLYIRHGLIPRAKWTLNFINRYTAHSIMSIAMKSEEV
ncbi:MAG: hypothetical protein DRP84_10255 [Spirochaetes bacterium]|nr:MAG: hypothetical protein DRP84_10255 [Spirochaetota bacterium]